MECFDEAESNIIVPVIGIIVVAIRRRQVPVIIVVPGAT